MVQRNVPPDWFTQLRDSITVRLIDTERLRSIRHIDLRRRSRKADSTELAVKRYAADLGATIQKKLAESAALSQSLDRTFPARLVQQGVISNVSDEDIRSQLADLENKRSRLSTAGLLDKDDDMNFQIAPESIDEHTKQVLTVYAQDVRSKLNIFDDISAKIELFGELVNNRFLYKDVSISKQEGFIFTGADGTQLAPADLSSGEQQEIVLLYELLFKVDEDSLILIDEPELSLHVAWQEQFLTDLHKITTLSPFDVLIATHSPQIIHDRWDLTIELTGPEIASNNDQLDQ